MTVTANLHLRDAGAATTRVDDCSTTSGGDLVAVRLGGLSLIGTLADALAVIGRAHEQLLAVQADRQAAEPTASNITAEAADA